MTSPVERLLTKLPNAKRAGAGWTARCPAHDDRHPSLSITQGDDGRALVNCHAGCTADAICGALGITMAELFPERERPRRQSRSGPSRSPKTYDTANAAVASLQRSFGKRSASWTYHNAEGEPVGVVLRWDGEARKEIRPVSQTDGGWAVKAMPAPRPLYGLPELAGADRIFITEGEKAADAARSLGFIATTSAGGSKAPQKTDWAPVAGKECVILPDNDDAGRCYAEEVASILAKLTPTPKVKVIELPDLPAGGDMVEFIAACSGDGETVRAEIEALVTSAESITPDRPAPAVEPYALFPVDALPKVLADYVKVAANSMQCDHSFVALPLLTATASAIGNARWIQLKPGWTEPSVIWTAIVGESGSMKSPAFRAALKALRDLQHHELQGHEDQMIAYENSVAFYERETREWKRGKSADDPPEKPVEPQPARLIVSDVTVEALAQVLASNERGVLLARDELGGWIGSFGQYSGGKGADVAHWLSMFNAEQLIVDRKTGPDKTLVVQHAACSITGGIQPGILRRAIGDEYRENGLLARFLLAWPPRRAKKWTESGIPPELEATIGSLFDRLRELTPDSFDGRMQPVFVRLTASAMLAWGQFFNAHAEEQTELTGDLAGAWAKFEGYAARLALLIHFVRWAEGDPTLESEDAVDAASLASSIALVEWFKREARRVFAMLHEDAQDAENRELIGWVDRRGGVVTVSEMAHGMRRYRGKSDEAHAALDDLVKAGFGQWEHPAPGAKGGRPSSRFRSVTVTETDRNEAASRGIGDDDSSEWGEL